MIRNDILGKIKPEFGHFVQDGAFFRYRIFLNHVKRGNAVGADHHKAVAQVVQFPDFAGFKGLVFFHVFLLFSITRLY